MRLVFPILRYEQKNHPNDHTSSVWIFGRLVITSFRWLKFRKQETASHTLHLLLRKHNAHSRIRSPLLTAATFHQSKYWFKTPIGINQIAWLNFEMKYESRSRHVRRCDKHRPRMFVCATWTLFDTAFVRCYWMWCNFSSANRSSR